MKATCPVMSPLPTPLTCPLRIMCMTSYPCSVRPAVAREKKPIPGLTKRLRKRWSCSIRLFGSGSLEKDSPIEIIAMKEEQETGFMHDLGLGKGQRHAHKTGQSLAQRVIPPLNMGGFSCLFAHGRM